MIEQLDSVDERSFRRTMARFATCVSVTTTAGRTGPVGCTTTAVMSLSLRPPTLLVSLCSTSCTLDDLMAAGRFAINVLSAGQGDLVQRFATGDPYGRFHGVAHSLDDGVPVIDEAAATVVCQVRQAMPALDHTLLLGTVLRTRMWPNDPLVLLDGQSHAVTAVA
jgi:flavin reductase (DIM6/NTAB) family NADH-FMN oxidoreductase RutF